MKRASRMDRPQASETAGGDRATGRLTVIGGADAALRAPAGPGRLVPRREPTPIVRLPVAPGRAPAAPRVVAEATLQVKRYRGNAAEEERYTATLDVASPAPAALLAALADAASRIEELAGDGSPEDHLILNIAIRR